MIENEPREITVIYHSDKFDDKKALAFVHSLKGYAVKSLDLAVEKVTPTQLAEIADKLDKPITELLDDTFIDPDIETGKEKSNIKSLRGSDLLRYLTVNAKLIRTPIVITGKSAFIYASAYDIVKKDLAQKDNKSEKANVEEKGEIK